MGATLNHSYQALRATVSGCGLFCALFCNILLTVPAEAGVVLNLETTHHAGSQTRLESTRMEVAGQLLKMDFALPDSEREAVQSSMVFRGGETPEIVVIRHQNQSFVVLDPNTVLALGSEMRAAMLEANAQIEALSPEQRAVVRQMLDAQLGTVLAAAKPPPSTVIGTSDRKTINRLPCRRYEVYRQGELIREVWVAPWNEASEAREAFATLHAMSDFYSGLTSSFEQLAASGFGGGFSLDQHPFDDLKHMDGFPVLTRNFVNGGLATEIVLRSIEAQDLDPTGFDPPAGYRPSALTPR